MGQIVRFPSKVILPWKETLPQKIRWWRFKRALLSFLDKCEDCAWAGILLLSLASFWICMLIGVIW